MTAKDATYFENRATLREWIAQNHTTSTGIWLGFYKKHTGKQGLSQEAAVEEALCFGWIDSQVNRIDDERYIQRFTPRNIKSVWSKINRERAERLIAEGKMTGAGLAKIEAAKENGRWDDAYASRETMVMPDDLKAALGKNDKARRNFNNFAPSYQNSYIFWVSRTNKQETRASRIEQVVKLAENNQKPFTPNRDWDKPDT